MPSFKVIRAVATLKNKWTIDVPEGFVPLSSSTVEDSNVVEVIFISRPQGVRDELFDKFFGGK